MASGTTQTMGKTLGDVFRQYDPNRSFEAMVVDQNQTLVIGDAVGQSTNGRVVVLGAPANEVQTIGITGTLSAGTFALKFRNSSGAEVWTDPIAYNTNTAGVQTGVDTALGASKVVVAGTVITAMTFTFSGVGYAGQAQPLIEINVDGLTGEEDTTVTRTTAGGTGLNAAVNEVQLVAMAGGSAGNYYLIFEDYKGDIIKSGAIAYNAADNAAVETILETALGANTVSVGGTVHTAMTLTFDGDKYKGRPQSMVRVDTTTGTWVGTSAAITRTTIGAPESTGGCCGIMAAKITTGSAEYVEAAVCVRDAIVSEDDVDFKSGVKLDAIAALAAKGILVRPTAAALRNSA